MVTYDQNNKKQRLCCRQKTKLNATTSNPTYLVKVFIKGFSTRAVSLQGIIICHR